ncbi:MAG: hypothetical protein ACXWTY_08715 [Methylobacter sp.]
MRLEQRIANLERTAEDATPPQPGIIVYCKGAAPTAEEQQQISQAEANGQHAVVFTVKSGVVEE